MEKQYRNGEISVLGLDEYVEICCDYLELISPETVVQRICGELNPKYAIAPSWNISKARLIELINSELARRNSWQGKYFM
jgi:radical SAM superfamily enzyme